MKLHLMSQTKTVKPLRLIVGLGNPGPQYASTRHNVGAVWVERLASSCAINLKAETRFKGLFGKGTVAGSEVALLLPTTYMNDSGASVASVARFFKIEPPQLLIAHDELAFATGVLRLKFGGGTNGHNGLKDIIPALGSRDDFHRLRIGVDHPGQARRVAAYLTQEKIPAAQQRVLDDAIDLPQAVLQDMVSGEMNKAMNALHAKPESAPAAPGRVD